MSTRPKTRIPLTGAISRPLSDKLNESISVKDFGAVGDGITDDTAAIQAALTSGGEGSTVFLPRGTYRINGTLTMLPGQKLIGIGWRDVPRTFTVTNGSILKQYSHANVPMIQLVAPNDGINAGRGGLEDLALIHSVPGSTAGTAYLRSEARMGHLRNVYIASFNTGIELGQDCWQTNMQRVLIFDAATCLYAHDAGGEDSHYDSCCFFSYRAGGTSVHLKNQVQKSVWSNCAISFGAYGVVLESGDMNGDGTGAPYKVQGTFIGCQFEDNLTALLIVSSSVNGPVSGYPDVTLIDCRGYNQTYAGSNQGQIFMDVQRANRIEVKGLVSGGYSTGFKIGLAGNIGQIHLSNPASTWGTTEATGALERIFRPEGPKPAARFTSTALSYTATNFTRIPFSVISSDTEGWFDSANVAIKPKRATPIEFKCQVAITSTAVGRYSFALYKNGTQLAALADQYIATAGQTLILSGSAVDTPNGTSDYYNVYVYSTASWALDTNNSRFSAKID